MNSLETNSTCFVIFEMTQASSNRIVDVNNICNFMPTVQVILNVAIFRIEGLIRYFLNYAKTVQPIYLKFWLGTTEIEKKRTLAAILTDLESLIFQN